MPTGRNELCPCGSGKKYKKCHLAADAQATLGGAADLDVAAIVDRAIHGADWALVDAVFEQGFALFSPGLPLEHVRPGPAGFTPAFQHAAQAELTALLEAGHDLGPGARDGLRMVLHLLRRFGGKVKLAASLAQLESVERDVRARTVAALRTRLDAHLLHLQEQAMSQTDPRAAATLRSRWADAAGTDGLLAWIERERLALLGFADWLALRVVPTTAPWRVRIAARVQDLAVARAEDTESVDAPAWARLAEALQGEEAAALLAKIAARTVPRMVSADEQFVHAIVTRTRLDADAFAAIDRLAIAARARLDHAAAAMLRAVAASR